MTVDPGARTVVGMTNHCALNRILIAVACSAVVSLSIGHLIDLGVQTLGSGPISTGAVIGDIAGLVGCLASVILGRRLYRRG
jgi:hypothetical protein